MLSIGYGQLSSHQTDITNNTRLSRSTSHDKTARLVAIDARETREEEDDENELQSLRKRIESSKYFTAFFYTRSTDDSFSLVSEELTAVSRHFTNSSSSRLYLSFEVFRL
jgi:hypothetical protein